MEEESPSLDELKKLKVVELKARLSSLGLQTSGRVIDSVFFLTPNELCYVVFPLLVHEVILRLCGQVEMLIFGDPRARM